MFITAIFKSLAVFLIIKFSVLRMIDSIENIFNFALLYELTCTTIILGLIGYHSLTVC